MQRLYVLRGCPFGHRAELALQEKNVAHELAFFERGKRPPELEALGPYAKSPTFFDGEARIYESSAVLEYIEDRFPGPALLPKGAVERAEVRMAIARADAEIGHAEKVLTTEKDEQKIAEAKNALDEAWPAWDSFLEKRGGPFLLGEAFTLADIALYPFIPALRSVAGIEVPSKHSHLHAWIARVAARPGAKVPS
jgi:glutathione S-transferase